MLPWTTPSHADGFYSTRSRRSLTPLIISSFNGLLSLSTLKKWYSVSLFCDSISIFSLFFSSLKFKFDSFLEKLLKPPNSPINTSLKWLLRLTFQTWEKGKTVPSLFILGLSKPERKNKIPSLLYSSLY